MTIANQYQVQNQPKEQKQELTLSNLVSNFPFKEIRPKQLEVLRQIADAINTGYKYIPYWRLRQVLVKVPSLWQ